MYGESTNLERVPGTRTGLSPRVRGIRLAHKPRVDQRRSIPACTGNPTSRRPAGNRPAVYPRVYGESPGRTPESPAGRGSIPACTGNPLRAGLYAGDLRVYPRVYGESCPGRSRSPARDGLSPRVRGIRHRTRRRRKRPGSIPACTGNPQPVASGAARRWVYPRVYGESGINSSRIVATSGLSPRVRGILTLTPGQKIPNRSIPACTGNPARATC